MLAREASDEKQERGRREATRLGCAWCWRWWLGSHSGFKGVAVRSLVSTVCDAAGRGCYARESMHSFSCGLVSTYYMPASVLPLGDRAGTKADMEMVPVELTDC